MFNSWIHILLVEVEHIEILWDYITHICTNDSKTLINIPINNTVRNKVVIHRRCWILTKHIPLDGYTYMENLQRSKLKYVEFVWTCSWPTPFIVVVELVDMHAHTDSEPSIIHTQNSLTTLCKILVLRESYTNSRYSLAILTMWLILLINHLILISFIWYYIGACNQSLVIEVKILRRIVTFLVSTIRCIVVAQIYVYLDVTKPC